MCVIVRVCEYSKMKIFMTTVASHGGWRGGVGEGEKRENLRCHPRDEKRGKWIKILPIFFRLYERNV